MPTIFAAGRRSEDTAGIGFVASVPARSRAMIDGTGATNQVSTDDCETDCTVTMKVEDFMGIVNGTLNAMEAFMGGKLKVQGDMSKPWLVEWGDFIRQHNVLNTGAQGNRLVHAR